MDARRMREPSSVSIGATCVCTEANGRKRPRQCQRERLPSHRQLSRGTTLGNTQPIRLRDSSTKRNHTSAKSKATGPFLGAHMSIAGGYNNAVLAAAKAGCDIVQLFTKNTNQWRAKPISDDDVRLFGEAVEITGIQTSFAHNCYLINLASRDAALWKKSVDAIVVEIQ